MNLKEKNSAAQKRWREAHPETKKARDRAYRNGDNRGKYLHAQQKYYLKKNFNVAWDQYEAMLSAQKGGCAICGSPDPGRNGRFAVDHDHQCCPGKQSCGRCVRGLLCISCNGALGMVRDRSDILQAAVAYLAYHRRGK